MTNENKLAEEWLDEKYLKDMGVRKPCKEAFLAGLEAGKDMAETDLATVAYMQGAERHKPKWHKVSDGDYPPCERCNCSINVLTDRGDIAYYNYDDESWIAEPASIEIDPPVAWCELPTFNDKESIMIDKELEEEIEKEAKERARKIAELEKEKCELPGIIQGKDEVIANLKEQNKDLCESLNIMNNRESELLDQIEKMKCCSNCKYSGACNRYCVYFNEWEWELAE